MMISHARSLVGSVLRRVATNWDDRDFYNDCRDYTSYVLTIAEAEAFSVMLEYDPRFLQDALVPVFNDAVDRLQFHPNAITMRLENVALSLHKDKIPDAVLVELTMRGVL
jgi:hypothetical protein